MKLNKNKLRARSETKNAFFFGKGFKLSTNRELKKISKYQTHVIQYKTFSYFEPLL